MKHMSCELLRSGDKALCPHWTACCLFETANAYAFWAKSQLPWRNDLWVSPFTVTMLSRRSSPSAGVTMRSTSAWGLVHQTKLKSKRILCMDFTVYICLLKVVPKYNAFSTYLKLFLQLRSRRNLTFPRGPYQRPQGFFCRLSPAPSVRAVLGFVDRAPGLGRIVEVVDDGYNPLSLGILQLFVSICGICIAFLCLAFILHQVFDFFDGFHVVIMFSYDVFHSLGPRTRDSEKWVDRVDSDRHEPQDVQMLKDAVGP